MGNHQIGKEVPCLKGSKQQDTVQKTVSETIFSIITYSAYNNCPNSSSLIDNKV